MLQFRNPAGVSVWINPNAVEYATQYVNNGKVLLGQTLLGVNSAQIVVQGAPDEVARIINKTTGNGIAGGGSLTEPNQVRQ